MTSGTAPGTTPAPAASDGRPETVIGAILVGLTVVGAIVVRLHPGALFLDRWGFDFIHPAQGNQLYVHVTEFRSTDSLVVGSILAALVVVARDRLRALACLVGPGLAVILAEYLLKPLIARRYAEVLTYPSGTTTAVAGVVTAWAVAVPGRIRPVVVAVGAFVLGLECIAVVALQWHYPTDALAGGALGIGVVLLLDGALHLAASSHRSRTVPAAASGRGPGRSGPPS